MLLSWLHVQVEFDSNHQVDHELTLYSMQIPKSLKIMAGVVDGSTVVASKTSTFSNET